MSVIITHISNIQFKKFQYINIHNGFLLDETKFKQSLLNENNETKQIVWDVHCGPISPLSHNQKKLLKIENISKKYSLHTGIHGHDKPKAANTKSRDLQHIQK
eukprot:455928_1